MESDYWHQRWKKKEIDPYLMAHWTDLNVPKDGVVFVPLCGKSLDMLWLAERGYSVLGVELSEIAVREFYKEADISPNITKQGDFIYFESPKISIYCGDFYALQSSHLSRVRAVFDRAALVALPENMQLSYITHLRSHLPDSVSGLLVTMEYDQTTMQGPPFAVVATEVRKLFEEFDDISDIVSDDIEVKGRTIRSRAWKYTRY